MNSINTKKAAAPLGHYSQAIVHNDTIYVAMQLGLAPDNILAVGTIEQQTALMIDNIEQILLAANSRLDQILKTTIYMTDMTL